MTLDELIEALQDLKKSGKQIGKSPVEFLRRKKPNKSVDSVRVKTDYHTDGEYRIELISKS